MSRCRSFDRCRASPKLRYRRLATLDKPSSGIESKLLENHGKLKSKLARSLHENYEAENEQSRYGYLTDQLKSYVKTGHASIDQKRAYSSTHRFRQRPAVQTLPTTNISELLSIVQSTATTNSEPVLRRPRIWNGYVDQHDPEDMFMNKENQKLTDSILWLSRRKYETTTDRYLGPRDPRYVRILIRCWPPPKGLSQYLKIKKFMSGFGDLLEFYHPQVSPFGILGKHALF